MLSPKAKTADAKPCFKSRKQEPNQCPVEKHLVLLKNVH